MDIRASAVCLSEAAVDVGEKTWGEAFLSATELIRSLPSTQLGSLGYRGRRCGFNTKHQSTKVVWRPCLHFRAKREQLERVSGLLPENQGRNLAVTVLCVPGLLDSGCGACWQRLIKSRRVFIKNTRLVHLSDQFVPGVALQ